MMLFPRLDLLEELNGSRLSLTTQNRVTIWQGRGRAVKEKKRTFINTDTLGNDTDDDKLYHYTYCVLIIYQNPFKVHGHLLFSSSQCYYRILMTITTLYRLGDRSIERGKSLSQGHRARIWPATGPTLMRLVVL